MHVMLHVLVALAIKVVAGLLLFCGLAPFVAFDFFLLIGVDIL